MSDRVANWNQLFIKLLDQVRSILVSTECGRTSYKIPKHIVQGFDRHEVSLNVQKAELERFKGAAGEGFREVK